MALQRQEAATAMTALYEQPPAQEGQEAAPEEATEETSSPSPLQSPSLSVVILARAKFGETAHTTRQLNKRLQLMTSFKIISFQFYDYFP